MNIRHVERLKAAGVMHAAGLAAYERRDPTKSGVYSFEVRPDVFPTALEARVREVPAAWAYFNEQPPGYRRLAIFYVISAKREETRVQRIQRVIDASAAGMRVGVLFGQTGPNKSQPTPGTPGPKPQVPNPRPLASKPPSSAPRATAGKRAKRR